MDSQTVENVVVIDNEPQANATQMGLTTFVLTGLYQKAAILPVLLAVSLYGLLGTVAAQGYNLIVFAVVMIITLRESLGVIEHAHLKNDNILGDLKELATRINLINTGAFTVLVLVNLYAPNLLPLPLATAIILGLMCSACAPLFGIAGVNYLFGVSRVDTDKLATLNKYASVNAGIICSLSYFLIRNPIDIKMLFGMAIVSFFSIFLFKKTNKPDITKEDWIKTREGAKNYKEPTINLGYFMILFISAAALLLYASAETAGGVAQLMNNIKETSLK